MSVWVEADPDMFDAVDPEFGDRYLLVEEGSVTCAECRTVVGPHLAADESTGGERMTWTPFWFRPVTPLYRLCEDCWQDAEEGSEG